MESTSVENSYLKQVNQQASQLEQDLRPRRAKRMMSNEGAGAACRDEAPVEDVALERMSAPGTAPVDVRLSGFWRWKSVVVPPNAYVVHTRRGHDEPLHCGLGVSFGFNPATDAFLVVPSAMQTILLNANCICRERQGVVVQGYVQWIIDDFKTAYRKLDFSDALDPMRVVNLQLREQAEAAIKDVVATMGIDDVLADKQPIIKELTARLRHVAEGDGQDKGLGLRIVTVQIKEAVVSSPKVWEMLQRPFRAERAREARLAELTHQAVVAAREAEAEKQEAAQRIATESDVARRQAEADAEAYDRGQSERARRARLEAETLAQTIAHEREKLEREAELARLRLEHELTQEGMRQEAAQRQARQQLEIEAARRTMENDLSEAAVQLRLIQALPAIAEKMPKPEHLNTVAIGGGDALAGLVTGLLNLVKSPKA